MDAFDFYQKRWDITVQDIATRIHLPSRIPRLICMISPCRSGSTAHLRVFSAAGIDAYYQPIKAIVRNLMHNETWDYCIPDGEYVFIKETLGPYSRLESTIEIIMILREIGYPLEKVLIVYLLREPLATLYSWLNTFSFNREPFLLFENFILAYKHMHKLRTDAEHFHIATHCYVYESLRDHAPVDVIKALFKGLGVESTCTLHTVSGWQALPHFGSSESKIIFPQEPQIYTARNFHAHVERSDALTYSPKITVARDALISSAWQNRIREEGIVDIYHSMRAACLPWLDCS